MTTITIDIRANLTNVNSDPKMDLGIRFSTAENIINDTHH